MPPAGFEPAHPPPEGGALSPELRGQLIDEVISPKCASRTHMAELVIMSQSLNLAYFGTGCFWGAERRFWKMAGTTNTAVGYMGGLRENPTYEQVCTGATGHAEVVMVEFDSSQISYLDLLKEFWTMHDPTTLNRQGGDIGTQYRSAIFYTSDEQKEIAFQSFSAYQEVLTKNGFSKITTEILPAPEFWFAEEYHQRYLEKNPNGYDCHSTTGIAYPEIVHEKI